MLKFEFAKYVVLFKTDARVNIVAITSISEFSKSTSARISVITHKLHSSVAVFTHKLHSSFAVFNVLIALGIYVVSFDYGG